ncbi:MAG: MFS transporter [Pseudomonadota bacterium]
MAEGEQVEHAEQTGLSSRWLKQDTRRWRLAWVLMISLFVGYMDRVNISLALPLMATELGWTDAELKSNGELLFSVFYIGYGAANIFLSPLAARIGPRRSLIIIVILWSIFTAVGAFASQLMLAFIASRVLLGLSEGVHFPMMTALTERWFPENERGRANSIWIAGLFLAVLGSPVLLVPAMSVFGWRVGFWGLALAGLAITLPLILRFVYDDPADAPDVSRYRQTPVDGSIGDRETENTPDGYTGDSRGRVIRLIQDPTFLLLLSAGILNNVVSLGLLSWVPSFFTRVKGLPYEDLAWAAALPYGASLIGVALWSNLGDRMSARAALAAIGYAGAGIAVFVSLTSSSIATVLTFFSVAVFFSAAYVAAEFALLQKALPRASIGGDVGLYNGLSTMIGGGLGPVIVSSIIGDPAEAGSVETLLIIPIICFSIAALLAVAYKRLRY